MWKQSESSLMLLHGLCIYYLTLPSSPITRAISNLIRQELELEQGYKCFSKDTAKVQSKDSAQSWCMSYTQPCTIHSSFYQKYLTVNSMYSSYIYIYIYIHAHTLQH